MKINNVALLVFASVISVAVGVVLGSYWSLRFSTERAIVDDISSQQSSAINSISMLTKIRSGDEQGAIELGEKNLDGAILSLGAFALTANKSKAAVLRVLEKARKYRESYPRRTADPELDQSIAKALALSPE